MRPDLQAGWPRWCAAILLALLAISMLHAAVPHNAAQRDCSTCKALDAPGMALACAGPGRPADGPSGIATLPPAGPLCAAIRCLKPLRAPPGSAIR